MKKILLSSAFLLFAASAAWAQPQLFNYQGIARNSTGSPLGSAPLGLRITIHDGSASGTVVYQETQSATTNAYGLYNLSIGGGTVTSGSFAGITWATGNKYIEVEIDPAGGTSYASVGSAQLLSVPYALYSAASGSTGVTSITAGTGLSGGTITSTGTISMPPVGTAGTYGSASIIPVITTDAEGRVSAVTTVNAVPTSSWNITGNAGTNSATNFIGTTDTAKLRFRVNNKWAGEINADSGNVALGPFAGRLGRSTGNVSIGRSVLYSNTFGGANVGIGDSALFANTTGGVNTAVGNDALMANTTGNYNSGFGSWALFSNTTGSYNTGLGEEALFANTTGTSNTAIGASAAQNNTVGSWNVAIGEGALQSGTSDSFNTAVGIEALMSTTTAKSNVAIGAAALTYNTTGGANNAVGVNALRANTTGAGNIAIGNLCLYQNTTGGTNVGVGYSGLQLNLTGSNNTSLGAFSGVSADGLTNATAIGYNVLVNGSNRAIIGNTAVTLIGGQVNWSVVSDGRFKSDVNANVPGLDFITKLRPVTYRFEARNFDRFLGMADSNMQKQSSSYDAAEAIIRTGFIAQEVAAAADQASYNFSGVHRPENEKDNYSVAYAEFTVPLVKAVQELNKKNEDLLKTIEALTKRIEELEKK